MAMPGSRIFIVQAACTKSPAWPTSDESLSTSTKLEARPSQMKRSGALRNSMRSRRKRGGRHQIGASISGKQGRSRSLTIWKSGSLAGSLAACPTARHLRQIAAGGRNPSCPDAHGAAQTLPRSRHSGVGQRHRRTRDAISCHWAQEPSIRGIANRRQSRRHRLHLDRNRQVEWHQSPSLACRHTRPHSRLQNQPGRRSAAVENHAIGRPDRTLTCFWPAKKPLGTLLCNALPVSGSLHFLGPPSPL